jgi:radical SAM-linked protein
MPLIDPVKDLAEVLRRVERPARYLGGEYGAILKEGSGLLSVAISYPDLYEIGMSNSAIRILYNLLNGIAGVRCERVFAPAPDFEAELQAHGIPLYSLETGRELCGFDILGFSLGYELTFTNLLAILELGGVGLHASERGEGRPIVLVGGPASTNPVPYGPFVDCVFIGEAEGWAEEAFGRMAAMKRSGAGREDLLGYLRSQPSIWYAGKTEVTRRSLWGGFTTVAARSAFPVPSIRVVQDHGTVEIMRGCPNACRFCHATCLYRPARHKDHRVVEEEVHDLINGSGYREITLSSLSSGEFEDIRGLVGGLNSLYAPKRVSFSLPSLHVDSLGLALLKEISHVRKSGLTFAVETPLPQWQQSIGKLAPLEKIVAILREARSLGWKNAKFYFMVGLPASFDSDESGSIIDYLREARSASGMMIHANVAAFIPKPHTPFQRAPQLTEEEALRRIMTVRKGLKGDGFKIGYHAPFLSLLEGIVSRGDERAGRLVLDAYRRGARLDAWEEHIRTDVWREVIARAGWDVEVEVCRGRPEEESLAWGSIALGLSQSVTRSAPPPRTTHTSVPDPARSGGVAARVLFAFRKTGKASYISHLDLMTVFERALARARYNAVFTEGFNPKPRIEFASPLGLGIESEEEIASVEIADFDDAASFSRDMSAALPPGISVRETAVMARSATGKKPSLMAAYWGSEYRLSGDEEVESVCAEHGVVASKAGPDLIVRLEAGPAVRSLLTALRERPGVTVRRVRTFALGPGREPVSYFDLFRSSALI